MNTTPTPMPISPARSLLAAILALAAVAMLNGCAALVVGGAAGAAALMVDDRRTSGAYVEDESIETKATLRINQRIPDGHINKTSYNRIVLLTGEAPSEQARVEAERIVRGIENVRGVQNELIVGPTTTLMIRSNDTVQTSKVKARFVDAKRFHANHVKVVTENGVVYLLGIVRRKEADDAAEIARTTSGVQRVVRVFEYLD